MNHIIEDYVEQRLCGFEKDGFSLLSRVPSSNTKRFLAAYLDLDADNRALYREAAARRAARWWGFPYDGDSGTPEAQLFWKIHRMAPYPDGILEMGRPRAKAPELRKIAKLAFEQLFGCQPEKSDEPGDWYYRGSLLGEDVSVQIRYTTRLGQILYGLQIGEVGQRHSFCFENFYGFGIGAWDLISVREADAAFAVLKEAVVESVRDFKSVQAMLKSA